jgi:hypothetical protein
MQFQPLCNTIAQNSMLLPAWNNRTGLAPQVIPSFECHSQTMQKDPNCRGTAEERQELRLSKIGIMKKGGTGFRPKHDAEALMTIYWRVIYMPCTAR